MQSWSIPAVLPLPRIGRFRYNRKSFVGANWWAKPTLLGTSATPERRGIAFPRRSVGTRIKKLVGEAHPTFFGSHIMSARSIPLLPLDEMIPGQEADVFLLLVAKEELTTKTGKPYHKVTFRGGNREVSFPIWADAPWSAECRAAWTPGVFYKIRAVYRETNFGPQLDIHKIREVVEADAADGFDPAACQPKSRFDAEEMFEELSAIVRERIERPELRRLVESILTEYRKEILVFPAARHNHHAFVGGLLEHTLSVAENGDFSGRQIRRLLPRHAAAVG